MIRPLSRSLTTLITKRPATALLRGFASKGTAAPKPSIPKHEPKSSNAMPLFLAAAVAGGAGYFFLSQKSDEGDYQKVYNAIAQVLDAQDYDDGSYGPVLVRLAWHAAGTYDKVTGTGGSNGATMRFNPESAHGANAGLSVARDLLEPIKKQFPWISYSDLWSLAGVVAIQEMGGPTIQWRPGRKDADTAAACTPDGRLPNASKTQSHLRDIFYRMGFNDQEIVALSGAHALGRCHTDRSGYEGPWTFSPTTLSADYFKLLLSEEWVQKKWDGPKQYVDKKTESLMMLPSDLALIQDSSFKPIVEKYAQNPDLFFADFSKAFTKLEELGVPFDASTPTFTFKTL